MHVWSSFSLWICGWFVYIQPFLQIAPQKKINRLYRKTSMANGCHLSEGGYYQEIWLKAKSVFACYVTRDFIPLKSHVIQAQMVLLKKEVIYHFPSATSSKKYGPMIPPAHNVHQIVHFCECLAFSWITYKSSLLQLRQKNK